MQGKEKKERNCMSFEGFTTCVRLDVQHMLQNASVTVQEIVKVNDVKHYGLSIMEDGGRNSNITPAIYLENFYEEYLEGRSLCDIEQDILEVYQRNKPFCSFDPQLFRNWDWIKERIVCRLVNMERNREYLKKAAYIPYLDFAVTFHCLLEATMLGNFSIPVCNSHLELWGITKEELYAAAMESMPKLLPPVIQDMGEVLGELTEELYDMELPMYILSNRYRNNGAVCLLYRNVLQEFADSLGADLYILPSSLHEVILLPVVEERDSDGLDEIVCIVNAEQLKPEEILSDHVYIFSRKTGKITMQEEKA